MNILFKEGSRVSLVVTPTDLRGTFQKPCSIAQTMLNIDVMSGSETVVFVSKGAKFCKIWKISAAWALCKPLSLEDFS